MSHATGVGYGVVEAVDDAAFVGMMGGPASTITVRVLVGITPGVGGDVVDGVGGYLRCVDQNISREGTVDEGAVRQIVALVVMHDCAEIGVGVADVDGGGIATLDVD